MDDRIKLAEAMGWTLEDGWWQPPLDKGSHNRHSEDELPDPENDPTADYAVLEWMRVLDETGMRDDYLAFMAFIEQLPENWRYQIGDYARAALKVIVNMEQT